MTQPTLLLCLAASWLVPVTALAQESPAPAITPERIEVALHRYRREPEVERVIAHPKPVCHLLGFGDNSVDLELRVWIADPQNGVVNVSSQVLLKVWDLYRENGIQFPFPQRDVHLMPQGPIDVRIADGDPVAKG